MLIFLITAALVAVSAVGAMALRSLVHCALCLALAFGGLGILYLQLGAEFVGLAQFLVYVGAVAVLIVFAILLTRASETSEESVWSPGWKLGVGAAAGAFVVLVGAILRSDQLAAGAGAGVAARPELTVLDLGQLLMGTYVLPLEAIAVLLTAALIGATLVAMTEAPDKSKGGPA